MPVSYTHLGAYQAQIEPDALEFLADIAGGDARAALNAVEPVSYTHLDVYKRQLYNCGNGILSATGDTKRPLVYLSIAGIVNVILNLFFVIVCHMAAEGVAIASVIGQYLSALLIVIHLLRRTDDCGPVSYTHLYPMVT